MCVSVLKYHPDPTLDQWRMQDLQTGGKVERRRREYRGAEGAEEVGCGKGVPLLTAADIFDFRCKNVDFQCILSAIFAVKLPIVQARNTALGLTKLAAAACMQ